MKNLLMKLNNMYVMSNKCTLVNEDSGEAYACWVHAVISLMLDAYNYHYPISRTLKTLNKIKRYIPEEDPEETTIKEEEEMKNEQVKAPKINSLPRWAELNDRDWLKEYKDLSTRTKLLNDYAAYRRRRERELMMYSEEGERNANAYTAEVLSSMDKKYDLRYVGNTTTDKMVAIVDLDPCCNEAGFVEQLDHETDREWSLYGKAQDARDGAVQARRAELHFKWKAIKEQKYEKDHAASIMKIDCEPVLNSKVYWKQMYNCRTEKNKCLYEEAKAIQELKAPVFKAASTALKKYHYMLTKSKNN